MAEQTFFDSDGVTVTNARFVVDGHTYAVRNITSCFAGTRDQKWWATIVWGSIAALVFFMPTGTQGILLSIIFLMFAGLAFYLGRPTHYVNLKTSSGEVQATKSRDLGYVRSVVKALNDAIVAQH